MKKVFPLKCTSVKDSGVLLWNALSVVTIFFKFSTFHLLNGIWGNLIGSKIPTSSTKFVFLCWLENKYGRSVSDWLRHFQLSSETNERNLRKLERKQELNVIYQVCVFWADLKSMMTPASDFRLFRHHFSDTTERNLKKLDRKQDINVLYHFMNLRPIEN